MKNISKTSALLILSIFMTMTILCAIPPDTTVRAAEPGPWLPGIDLSKLPESTPGNFTVTWYSCKRYVPGQEPGAAHAGEVFTNLLHGAVDKDRSDAALGSYDTSVCLKQEVIPTLTFDMTRWQPDGEYYEFFNPEERSPRYNWTWCEVDGFIRLPYNGRHLYSRVLRISTDSLLRSDVTSDLVIPGNGSFSSGDLVPFRLRIKCYEPDQSKLNTRFSIVFAADCWQHTDYLGNRTYKRISDIPAGNVYGTLALKDMQPFFQLDAQNYTLTLDPQYGAFPVGDYEYGYAGGTDFKPLAQGANYLEPANGDVIVCYKSWPNPFITIGAVTLQPTGYLSITGRTPATSSLSWSAPTGGAAPTGYDIYRQKVDWMSGLSPSLPTVHNTFTTVQKVGSTTGLTFTDQGLDYNMVYAYYVKANYPAGNSTVTNTVRTDSVTMQDLPSTPLYLRADNQTQTSLTLHWNGSQSPYGIKEYIIYRKTTWNGEAKSTVRPDGSFVISGGISSETPVEIGRSSSTSFKDSGLDINEQCEYYVQAVDGYGIPSLISSPLKISIPDLTPPTAPGSLQAGNVLRQGDEVQYVFPEESGFRNAVLGPKREIALRWEPSTDNAGVVGYNIYRLAMGADWCEKKHLVGSTKDTFFIDSGLEFGASFTYYVEAVDAQGNQANNEVWIGTEKSTLTDLTIANGSQNLTPDPVFVYYQTEYTINVENAVKSINLKAVKTDLQAQVKVNGTKVAGDGSIGPLALDPGGNTINIEIVPRQGAHWFIEPETMRYTLTVNRANLTDLPVITLPESGTVVNEGDMYRAAGRIDNLNNLVWTGTADYGDGTGEKPLQLNKDGSFVLEHKYLDNGQYKINVNFRYTDLGLVKGSLEVTAKNVAPTLTGPGIKDEITTQEGSQLTIEGNIVDPGQDSWTVSGDYGSEWGPTQGKVNGDKTFTLQDYFNDLKPEYDMELKVVDDDGGLFSKDIKIKVENVAPSVQAGEAGMIQRGVAFTGAGVFTDPGVDNWQATVDYGDGSGQQPLTLKNAKTFDLNHTYLQTGIFTVTVRVEDQDGGEGSASFQVKVKDYLFTLKAGADTPLQEGEKLVRDIPVQGRTDKVKSITVDYGDGTGEEPVALPTRPGTLLGLGESDKSLPAGVGRATPTSTAAAEPGFTLPLTHIYADNGTCTVKTKIIDADGDSYEDSFKVEVANVPPAVQMESIGTMHVGNTFTAAAA